MLAALPPEAASLLALAALLVLPGLLVVRAPWTAVPALSLAFWVLTLQAPPIAVVSRSRFVGSALVAFALLALLRVLPKHEMPRGGQTAGGEPSCPGVQNERPASRALEARAPAPRLASGPSILVVVVALALLASFPRWHHAPGPEMAFQTTAARLLAWRDGLPLSGEPLLPLVPFGAHAPALATLAADVSHLSGLDPAPALLLVALTAVGLLLIGLFALYATVTRPWAAALGALFGLAAVPWPEFVAIWGEGGAIVGLSFGFSAAALLLGHASRSSALAASLLLAASALGQPLLGAVIAVAVVAATVLREVGRPVSGAPAGLTRRAAGRRLALAFGLALVWAGPYLVRLARVLSAREAMAILASPTLGDLRALAMGLVVLALSPVLASVLAPVRSGPRGLAPGQPDGHWVLVRVPLRRPAALAFAAASAWLLVARIDGWISRGQLPVEIRSAIARAGAATSVVEAICAPQGARDWIPALAGRAVGEPGPWIPPVYRGQWAGRVRRSCSVRLETFLDDS
jgi:hypothetical protein